VVLDEICTALHLGLVSERDIIALLDLSKPGQIIVLTGRGAPPALMELADTVTEMKCIKHGYDSGIKAQKGVEK
jgi:cob(I)alamin adenosyltransferase